MLSDAYTQNRNKTHTISHVWWVDSAHSVFFLLNGEHNVFVLDRRQALQTANNQPHRESHVIRNGFHPYGYCPDIAYTLTHLCANNTIIATMPHKAAYRMVVAVVVVVVNNKSIINLCAHLTHMLRDGIWLSSGTRHGSGGNDHQDRGGHPSHWTVRGRTNGTNVCTHARKGRRRNVPLYRSRCNNIECNKNANTPANVPNDYTPVLYISSW